MKKLISCLLIAALATIPCAAFAEDFGALGVFLKDDPDGRLFGNTFEALCEKDDIVCMTRYAKTEEEQAAQITELEADCEVIIVRPLGAVKTSVPLIALEDGVPGAVCTISFDADEDARLIAEEILTLAENAEAPINIECAAGDAAKDKVYEKAMALLQPAFEDGSIVCPSGETAFDQVATGGERLGDASSRMEKLLKTHYANGETLNAVLCSDSEAALGVMQSFFFAYDGETPHLTSAGCTPSTLTNIIDGLQPMTTFHDPRTQAEAAYTAAKTLLTGKTPEKTILCTPVRMDKTNCEALAYESTLYERDEFGYPVDDEGLEVYEIESDPAPILEELLKIEP